MRKIIIIMASAFLLYGCSVLVRHVPIEQGNVFSQAMVNQLQPGMTKQQVQKIMGAPVLNNAFDSNQWQYINTYHKGDKNSYQRVTLTFKNNQLQDINGTMVPSQGQ